ncbi:hypothetical protein [Clostridium beijerinckii]|uniref:hypothetical protein n=1 Tax=Clostridium beijerinckii TaxID=1520 RepID=UPI00156D9369|nr:hypothetical protein [Clostridium beijerinckii]NRT69992.1 hypothetical protein [Clostridium beijerinckii]
MNLSIIPYVFNTVGQSYNYYNKLYLSVGTNHKERLDSLFYNFQNDSAISATDLSSVTSGYSTVTDYGQQL